MTTRKSTFFYSLMLALACVVVGMVIAARLDLSPTSFGGPLTVPSTNSAPLEGIVDATTFRTIAHEASPTVVSIRVTSTRPVSSLGGFFGLQPGQGQGRRRAQPDDEQPVQGAGSGFIIDKANGYILTNNHVIDDARIIEVKLSRMDDQEPWLPAKLVGHDSLIDIALIQLTDIPKDGLAQSKFGDSSLMQPGDWVMAIGNPFQLSNTVTVGVVSAVGRQNQVAPQRFEDFIQTDAAINRGNSGGPLLNIRGEVVGINTAIVSDQGGGNVGVGFAVPINSVRDILPQLRTGKVVRGRIGVTVMREPMSRLDAEDRGLSAPSGAVVSSVEGDGPAGLAGVHADDVIVEFNGRAVRDNNDLVTQVTATTPGTTVPVKVLRDRKALNLTVKVGALDLEQEQTQSVRPTAPPPSREEPRETSYGMTIQELTPTERSQLRVPANRGGAIVVDVTPLGPAQQGDVREGDVILRVQGADMRNADAVSAALDGIASGRSARLLMWRVANGAGQEILVQVRKR